MKIRLNKRKIKRNIRIAITFVLVALLVLGAWAAFKFIRDWQAKKLKLNSDVTYTAYVDSGVSDLVKSYMDTYYTALSSLTACDMTQYFDMTDLEGYQSAQLNQVTVEYMLMQRQNSPWILHTRNLHISWTLRILRKKTAWFM
jgi:hypothetical protein